MDIERLDVAVFPRTARLDKQRMSANGSEQTNPISDNENAKVNGRYRNRTCDPLIKSQLLYRLS